VTLGKALVLRPDFGAVERWVPACAGKARKELSISISIRIFSQTLSIAEQVEL
jgi:hypothetical protein